MNRIIFVVVLTIVVLVVVALIAFPSRSASISENAKNADLIIDFYNQYKELVSNEDWQKAEKLMRDAIRHYPKDFGFVSGLGYSLRKQEKFKEALGVIEPVYRKNIGDDDLHEAYLYALIDMAWAEYNNDYDEGAFYFADLAYHLDPENQWSLNAYGYFLYIMGDTDEAIAILKTAWEEFPDNSSIAENLDEVLISLAWEHYENSRFDEAVLLFSEIYNEDSQNDEVIYGYALALRESGEVVKSLSLFEKGMKLYPDYLDLQEDLVLTYISIANNLKKKANELKGKNKSEANKLLLQAQEYYDSAKKIDPDNSNLMI